MLEVRNVTKRYGALTAVIHLSFTVRPGEVLGYLGPNGSDKSTTVKMLAGLMPPSFGRILYSICRARLRAPAAGGIFAARHHSARMLSEAQRAVLLGGIAGMVAFFVVLGFWMR